MITRPFRLAAVCLAVAAVFAGAAVAAERLTDKQLEQHIQTIDRGFDEWKDALERNNYDDAVIKSAAGTIRVEQFLEDFEKDIDTLKERYNSNYAASREAVTLLRRASDVERRYQRQGGPGASEWSALSGRFATLATAYGASWPIDANSTDVGRLGDKELASRVQDLERSANRLRNEADKAAGQAKVDKPTREALKSELTTLERNAKDVRERVQDGHPASSEVSALLGQLGGASSKVSNLPLSAQGKQALSSLDTSAAALARAFGESWPR
jgi:hypothetical protein